jgi:hypothetical protein
MKIAIIVPAGASAADHALALSLRLLEESSHQDSECNAPIHGAVAELFCWLASGALVWVGVGYLL